jgi:hypothetical protein
MSTISASTTSTTAYKVTGDTTGTLVLQTGSGPTTAVTIDGSQNVTLAGTKLNGDFSNATVANRMNFQTSTTNGSTGIYALPNGTSTAASWQATNAADPTNASKVLIATNGSTDVQLVSGRNGTGTYLPLTFYTNGSEQVRVDTSGNVGIGTASPSTQLHVSGTNAVLNITRSAKNFYLNPNYSNGNSYATFESDLALAFNVNAAERARIDSSGNLLVGTTSGSGYRMEVTTSGVTTMKVSRTGLSGANSIVDWFYNTTNVGSVAVSSTATSYNTSSDYRLKNSVAPMTGALAKVAALKPCTYKWNADDSDGEGFIAHELAEVMPHAVTGEKDAVNEDGSIKPQGIDTSFLVATLTAAIQEQQAIIETLTNRISALENK